MWTEQAVDLLKQIVAEKKLTASKMSLKLSDDLGYNVTRNAVIGKLHRLGLKWAPLELHRLGVSWAPLDRNRKKKAKRSKVAKPSTFLKNTQSVPIGMRRTLETLTVDTCRYPFGDPRQDGFHYCGYQVDEASSYCHLHGLMVRERTRNRAYAMIAEAV